MRCWICCMARSKWRPSWASEPVSIISKPCDEARLAAREDEEPPAAAATWVWVCCSRSASSSVRPSWLMGTVFCWCEDDMTACPGESLCCSGLSGEGRRRGHEGGSTVRGSGIQGSRPEDGVRGTKAPAGGGSSGFCGGGGGRGCALVSNGCWDRRGCN